MGISTSILGLTVIAVGNSSGDLVANVAAAKSASAKMAVASCFGSPVLMNLIGAGAALSVRFATSGGAPVAASISQICRLALRAKRSAPRHVPGPPGYDALWPRTYSWRGRGSHGAFSSLGGRCVGAAH